MSDPDSVQLFRYESDLAKKFRVKNEGKKDVKLS